MPETEFNEQYARIGSEINGGHFTRYYGMDFKMGMVYYKESECGISFGKDSVIYGTKDICFGSGLQRSRLAA